MKMMTSFASLALAVVCVACGGGGGSLGSSRVAPVPATVNPVVAWANAAVGTGTCFSRAVAVHPDGWSVVVGSMDTSIALDPSNTKNTLASPTGTYTGFVARYEKDGKFGWQVRLECDKPCTAYSVAVMTDGDVAVCGYFEGTLTLRKGSKSASSVTLTSTDGDDAFLARYAGADGSLLWGVRIGGKSATQALGVAPLSNGSCVVCGLFVYEAYFYTDDETNKSESPSFTAANVVDGFVAQYDSKGGFGWAVATQGTDLYGDTIGYSAVWSVSTRVNDGGDTIVVAGSFADALTFSADKNKYVAYSTLDGSNVDTSDVFVASIAPNDGYLNWAQVAGGTDYDETYSVAVDPSDGSVRLTGTFRGDILFDGGNTTVYGSTTGQNAFLAKYKSDGSFAWANGTIGNTKDDAAGFSSAIDSAGGTVIIGWFWGTLSFDGGSTSISNTDGRDIFMARYDTDGKFDWAKVEPGTDKNAALGCAILTSDDTIWVCGYYHESLTLIGTDNGDGTTKDTTLSGDSGVMNGFLARFDDDGSI